MRSGVIAFNRHSTRDRIFDIAIIAVSYDAEKISNSSSESFGIEFARFVCHNFNAKCHGNSQEAIL